MWTFLVGLLTNFGGSFSQILSQIISGYAAYQEKVKGAFINMQVWISRHANDGAISVEERESAKEQNAALDKIAHDLDNPVQVIVEEPKK
jgi:hypothetical protein